MANDNTYSLYLVPQWGDIMLVQWSVRHVLFYAVFLVFVFPLNSAWAVTTTSLRLASPAGYNYTSVNGTAAYSGTEIFLIAARCLNDDTNNCQIISDLFRFNGTQSGTKLIAEGISDLKAATGPTFIPVAPFTVTPEGLFFASYREGLIRYNAGTRSVIQSDPLSIREMKTFRGRALFPRISSSGNWLSAASAAGVVNIKPMVWAPQLLTVANEKLYFFVPLQDFVADSTELWVSDGTEAGTTRITNIPGSVVKAVSIENRLVFASQLGTTVNLWTSDGTLTGTRSHRTFVGSSTFAPHVNVGRTRDLAYWYVGIAGPDTQFATDGFTAWSVASIPFSLNVGGTEYRGQSTFSEESLIERTAPVSGLTDRVVARSTSAPNLLFDPVTQRVVRVNNSLFSTSTKELKNRMVWNLTFPANELSFQENSGVVSIEAEHYDFIIPKNAHTWNEVYPTGRSGYGAMTSGPNIGKSYGPLSLSQSPRIDYQINFKTTGTYFLWLRGSAPSSADNTVHVGLNGIGLNQINPISGFNSSLAWRRIGKDGAVATLTIPTIGVHTLNLWMNEDGLVIDKILLTQSSTYSPSQTGITESPRGDHTTTGVVKQVVKSASASSTLASNTPPSAVVDGNSDTRWVSVMSLEPWLKLDFGVPMYLDDLKITWGTLPIGYLSIESSYDGLKWHALKHLNGTEPTLVQTIRIAGTGRYYRILNQGFGTNVKLDIAEVSAVGQIIAPVETRIDVASTQRNFVDSKGSLWRYDMYYNTGTVSKLTGINIASTTDDSIYLTERLDPEAAPALSYRFAAANGNYTLRLHFAETSATLFAVGKRVFDIKVENVVMIDNLDIFSEAGGNTALIKSLPVTLSDGELNIDFVRQVNDPNIRGIELIPR